MNSPDRRTRRVSIPGGVAQALFDPEPALRRWAVRCLGKIGHAAAPANPVLERLRDNDAQTLTRQQAGRALDAIGAELAAACPADEPGPFNAAWRTATVVEIARGGVLKGDFAAMPILADALEEAGCSDAELL